MKCSVCLNEIKEEYCSNCGQYYKAKRLNFRTIIGDFFDSVFSLEKSFFRNIKIGLSQPDKLVLNYWSGFRRFYYSPGKFFAVASLFLLLNYSIANDFFGTIVTGNISSQFVILLTNIVLLTLSSFLTYLQFKKNIFEHLVLNIYNVSLWTIVFVPIAVILNLTLNGKFEQLFYIPYHILIIVWNSRAFQLSKIRRFISVIINLLLFYGTLALLVYQFGEF